MSLTSPACSSTPRPPANAVSDLSEGTNYLSGDTVTIRCRAGYAITPESDSTALTCGDDGTWGALPDCVKGKLSMDAYCVSVFLMDVL